ncbi:hypothetical protein [Pseudomonas aeruginosa]|uniref:hypothetical protein n=1 Tax=Pseudomonas aeruginosa TaxID=287 RepID=UPI0034E0AAC9
MRPLAIIAILFAHSAFGSQYDTLIDSAARSKGIDPIVMRAIAQKESGKHPWTFNCDGEGFYFKTKNQAVWALWQISKNPWMAKVIPVKGEPVRQFFPTRQAASAFMDSYKSAQIRAGLLPITVRSDNLKELKSGQGRIRQLWVVNTDIGIAQVNYRFHGVSKARVQQWFDPAYNLNYAASEVARHKRSGKSDLEAAGDYHSKTPSIRSIYMKALLPIYQREKARAFPALANN